MPIDPITDVAQANDKYRAQLRSTWIASPADTSLLVNAVPANVPTIVTLGWNTDLETVFSVEGKTGDSAANYALTGVVRIKGANVNLPENTPVNCLNHEEFFNQYEEKINLIIDEVNEALLLIEDLDKSVVTTASSGTPTPTGDAYENELFVTALAAAAELQAPSGTPANGNKLLVRIKDNGTARALTYNAIYSGIVSTLPATTTLSKVLYMQFVYNSTSSKWEMVGIAEEE